MLTALFTAVCRFPGSHLARAFAGAGWRVVGLDDEPADSAELHPGTLYQRMTLPSAGLRDFLQATQPQVCIHAVPAAVAGEEPGAAFRRGALSVLDLLDGLRAVAPGCRFILLSDASVYGGASSPLAENSTAGPVNQAGWVRRHAENLCAEFASLHGLHTTVARVFHTYAPGVKRGLLWEICERVLRHGQLMLRGNGRETCDLLHADDLARALVLLAGAEIQPGLAFNIASGVPVAMREMTSELLRALASPVPAVFDGGPQDEGLFHGHADITRLAALGWQPAINLETGLRDLARWAITQC